MRNNIFDFSNTYAKLPKNFYEKINPRPVKNPELIEFNSNLSRFLNIDPNRINDENGKLFFSGNVIPDGARPIAMAYAGHQFGNFVPQLGDGRAILIGELIATNGKRFDIQLKGSGKTSFSRQGDGRSPLGPVIREYLVSESLHYLGIQTTRSLAIVRTGEKVFRETPMPGGILTRVASSHIRIGTFEFFFYKNDIKSLKKLADYTIARYSLNTVNKNRYEVLLKHVIKSQAKLISKWLSIGFIHGVMNTDNTSISGETIDYGPCAFMDHYNPNQVFSYIDYTGRYSYINQGKVMFWNLSKFAESLLPLLNENMEKSKEKAVNSLKLFPKYFEENWSKEMSKKIGLKKSRKKDLEIINDFLELLKNNNIDFTLAFRELSKLIKKINTPFFNKNIKNRKQFTEWSLRWKKRLEQESFNESQIAIEMDKVNPIYIPRNHLVENIIKNAELHDDFSPMKEMLDIIKKPFSEKPLKEKFSLPPEPHEVVPNTFCGT